MANRCQLTLGQGARGGAEPVWKLREQVRPVRTHSIDSMYLYSFSVLISHVFTVMYLIYMI